MLETRGDAGETDDPGGVSCHWRAPRRLEGGLTPRLVIAILRRRWMWMAASLVLIPVCAVIALGQMTARYTATGTLIYNPITYRMTEMQSILRPDPINDVVIASQAELLRGLPIIEHVAITLHLFDQPEFNPDLQHRGVATRLLGWLNHRLTPRGPEPVAVDVGPVVDNARAATLANAAGVRHVHHTWIANHHCDVHLGKSCAGGGRGEHGYGRIC